MSPIGHIFDLLFPATCACCGSVLAQGERQICFECIDSLGHRPNSLASPTPAERLLMGRFSFEHAVSLYSFGHGNTVQAAVHAIKFHGCTQLGLMLGRQMGMELAQTGFFDDVDLLLPVPLHWWRMLQRGYNQSELLCRGIAEVLPRPVDTTSLVRHRNTRKQSQQRAANRQSNVQGAFRVRHPDCLVGKHILLVDDVLTTGATLVSCADALACVEGLRVSVAVLAQA